MLVVRQGERWAEPPPRIPGTDSGKQEPSLSHICFLSVDVSEGNGQGNHI